MDEQVVTPTGADVDQIEISADEQVDKPIDEVIDESVEQGVIDEIQTSDQKKQTVQARINEITKARREAEREREYWKKIALEKETEVEKPPVKPSDRPLLHQFDTTEEYEDAVYEWRKNKDAERTRVTRQTQEHEEALRSFNARAKELRATHDDFDEVIESPVFSSTMRLALLRSENGPEVAYHLGRPENREAAEKILSLPPEMQTYEIGKLEARLMIAKQTKKVPGAPAPIKPVGITGMAGIDESKLSDAEWYALEKQRTLEKLKQRTGG